jgi:hypothetical protein
MSESVADTPGTWCLSTLKARKFVAAGGSVARCFRTVAQRREPTTVAVSEQHAGRVEQHEVLTHARAVHLLMLIDVGDPREERPSAVRSNREPGAEIRRHREERVRGACAQIGGQRHDVQLAVIARGDQPLRAVERRGSVLLVYRSSSWLAPAVDEAAASA